MRSKTFSCNQLKVIFYQNEQVGGNQGETKDFINKSHPRFENNISLNVYLTRRFVFVVLMCVFIHESPLKKVSRIINRQVDSCNFYG